MGVNWNRGDLSKYIDFLESGSGDAGADGERVSYINLSAGESATVIFLAWEENEKIQPYGYLNRWDSLEGRGTPAARIADQNEQLPTGGPRYERPSKRMLFCCYNCQDKEVQIFDANKTTAVSILGFLDLVPPGVASWRITRHGATKTDTVYKLEKIKDLSEKQQEDMRQIAEKDGIDLESTVMPQKAADNVPAATLEAVKPVPRAVIDDDESLF